MNGQFVEGLIVSRVDLRVKCMRCTRVLRCRQFELNPVTKHHLQIDTPGLMVGY